MANFVPISTNRKYNLKAGSARLRWRPAINEVQFTAADAYADAAHTATTTTITTTGNPAWKIGDELQVIESGEFAVVTADTIGAGPYTTTVVRGVDATGNPYGTGFAITSGAKIQKCGHAVRVNNGSGYALAAFDITIDTIVSNPQIDAADKLILRRGFDTGSEEILVVVAITGSVTVTAIRNYTNKKGSKLGANQIADNDFLFVSGEGFYPVELSDNKATKYQELEVKDGVEVGVEFDVVKTDSNLRVGGNFANHMRYMATFDSAVVSAQLLGSLMPNTDASVNYPNTGTTQYIGHDLDTFFGDEMVGVQIYIEGREVEANKRLEFIFPNAQINTNGAINMNADQRIQNLSFDGTFEVKMLSNGVKREPLVC